MSFTPKGKVAEWRLLYAAIQKKGLDYGVEISYEEIDEAIGRDSRTNRAPIYRAAKELLLVHQRALAPVRGEGYRIVQAAEMLDLAQQDRRAGRRKISKGVAKLTNVDYNELTPGERQLATAMANHFRGLEAAMALQNERIERVEKALQSWPTPEDVVAEQQRSADLEQRVEDLTEALRRHGML